eukprot:9076499-Pyramimonas_sp.AAC.1
MPWCSYSREVGGEAGGGDGEDGGGESSHAPAQLWERPGQFPLARRPLAEMGVRVQLWLRRDWGEESA